MFTCLLTVCLLYSLNNSSIANCEEFKMFYYIGLLYHVIWPDDCLTNNIVTLYSIHLTTICYLTFDILHLILDMLSLDTNVLYRDLTCQSPDSWLTHLRGLDMIIIPLPDSWYSSTLVFLNPWNRETSDIILLILYSCWSRKWLIMDIRLLSIHSSHYTEQFIIKYSTYTGMEETDGINMYTCL